VDKNRQELENIIEQYVNAIKRIEPKDVGNSLRGELIMAVITKPNGDKLVLYEGRDVDLQGQAVGVWMRG
jgi:23S rRNA A2030 N6-methylase RlmJ